MRNHDDHIELSRDEAVYKMLDSLPESFYGKRLDLVDVNESYGRILAENVLYKNDVPNVLTCSMDSVAVRWSDFENLDEDAIPDTKDWARGVEWEFANTGVAMPEGFDTAIVIEHVEVSEDEQHITIEAAPSGRFAGTRAAGSTATAGEVAVEKGCIITPDIAARIASAGVSAVAVVAKPRVAFIPTGDELISPSIPFPPHAPQKFAGRGRVYESNSTVARGKVKSWGGQFELFDIIPDDRDAIRAAILRASKIADIIILNAGSSKGSDDWSLEVLEELGQVICHQTNHGPGHHSSYTIVDGVPIVGISGPSGGASFTLNFYLLPLMRKFFGLNSAPTKIPARLAEPFPLSRTQKLVSTPSSELPGEQRPAEAAKPEEMFYSIKFLTLSVGSDGMLVATPVPGHPGTAETQHANAYYMMPAGVNCTPPEAGEVILVELRNQVL
ncbi:MAG: molybdopterin-binding protein [Slackia sp.]|uniref:molybdopterin-binding protein n=1 Tax=Slackia sp. TaxID=2049041 RepID=UPI00283FB0AE|nr:molybdopterin-binding protein [Slackia sp.]MDR3900127.1 molybdopterin-binding protein [Slackia sp.]